MTIVNDRTEPEISGRADEPPPGTNRRRGLIAGGVVIGVIVVAAGAFGVTRNDAVPAAVDPVVDARLSGVSGRIGAGSIAETVAQLEERVTARPQDDVALATLGVAYVELARISGDASLYERADEVLDRSFEVNADDNFLAYAGRAAVAAARHDFATAEREAAAGLEINPANATLWGVLSDAQIQLGKYDEGFASVRRMADLSPDIASITRTAYTYELTGDVDEARRLMQRALDEAFSGDDRAFALFQLGELALSEGDANTALGYFNEALAASPSDISSLSGKAHALGVAGQTETAIANYEQLLERVSIADFMIEFGEFLEGADRSADAAIWYDRARAQVALDEANGVQPDAGLIFFETDHGDPLLALERAEAAVAARPFFELHEAHGWALYRTGRYDEAVAALERAASLGIRDPELNVRAAIVHQALGNSDAATAELALAHAIDPAAEPYLIDADRRLLAAVPVP